MTNPGRILSWLIYPATIAFAFALFAALQWAGVSLVISTYVPVLATAAIVAALESAIRTAQNGVRRAMR